ncbi:hypothetical protein [Alloyangia pacifica]|uniref:hypothetical protein n=1 Tax=Alloyangia pacifica TaxID=311180 RepID=UPI001CD64130|nr:hypothetical protein [Alloyangia pacifica]MCA0996843.1 hypothetical protein [Alloyangia pacifica]
MAFCKRNSPDPLARQLFDKYGFTLVSTARSTDEIFPGAIIRVGNKSEGAICSLQDINDLYDVPIDQIETEFRLMEFERSGEVSAKILVELLKIPGFSDIPGGELHSALESISGSTLHLELSGGARIFTELAKIQNFFGSPNTNLEPFKDNQKGARYFVVFEIVVASQAFIHCDSEISRVAKALLDIPSATEVALEGGLTSTSQSVIKMRNSKAPMVIGFKCAELQFSKRGAHLRALNQPLDVLAEIDTPSNNEISNLLGDDIFVSL